MAGEPQKYSVDSTGKMTSTPVTSRGTLAQHIVAGAILGMLKGAGTHGPGGALSALSAGGEAGANLATQQNETAQNAAENDYKRQQDVLTNKLNATEKNLRMRGLALQLADADQKLHQQVVDNYAPQLQQLQDESPDQVLGQHVSETDAKDPNKYGLTAQRIPDGVVPKVGPDGKQVTDADGTPQWEQTYAIVKPDSQVPLTDAQGKPVAWSQQATEWGIPGPYSNPDTLSKLGPNQSASLLTANHVTHTISTLQATEAEINKVRASVGAQPIDLKAMIKQDPSLINAAMQFQRSSGASTQADTQIDAMRQDKQASPYVGKMLQLFGADNLEKYKADRVHEEAFVNKKAE